MMFLSSNQDSGQRKRLAILRFLCDAESKQLRPPTLAEVKKSIGAASLQMVKHHLSELQASGLVARGRLRQVRLTDQGRDFARYADQG